MLSGQIDMRANKVKRLPKNMKILKSELYHERYMTRSVVDFCPMK
jgi:hypothetical protein